jgi:hypothetical protein
MKHTLELLICSAIGGYCVWRCIAVMPNAYAEVLAVIFTASNRIQDIEAAIEDAIE